jgi:hypothetical protein
MLEILEQYVTNKEATDLEHAGVVNLEKREKPIEVNDDEEEGDHK